MRSIRRPARLLALLLLLLAGACVFRTVKPRPLPTTGPATPVRVSTPVKAHLVDGSTVVFAQGATIRDGVVEGHGNVWSVALAGPRPVLSVPLDSVAAMETWDPKVNVGASIVGTALGVGAGALAAAALAVALFGSCPTIYTDSGGAVRLEAESFSYSIAPLFERRDVDPLRARPGPDGRLVLEVRNEALETHYINHLEVLAIAHRPSELVLPGRDDHPVALDGLVAPLAATDRARRDVQALVVAEDGRVFATDEGTLAAASARDPMDHLELTFDASAAAGDSVALVLSLRNSLLNTVLFYDVMLGGGGARALDWMGRDLGRIDNAVAMARWYGRHMGLKVEAWQDGRWVQVASVGDAGPIAWRRLAVPVARSGGPRDSRMRLRLSYVADQWRIDRVALATALRPPAVRRVPVAAVGDASGATSDADAVERLRAPDARYVMTTPGTRFYAHFAVGTPAPGETITTMVAAQGYYTEWVRGDWLRQARDPRPFVPHDSALDAALARWRATRTRMERDFDASRIPVR